MKWNLSRASTVCLLAGLMFSEPVFSQSPHDFNLHLTAFKQEVGAPVEKKLTSSGRSWFYTALQINYVLLNAVDLGTTFYSLDRGAKEANPFARTFIKNRPLAIVMKAGITGGVLWGLAHIKKEDPAAAYLTLGLLNVVYGLVVKNNIGVSLQLGR